MASVPWTASGRWERDYTTHSTQTGSAISFTLPRDIEALRDADAVNRAGVYLACLSCHNPEATWQLQEALFDEAVGSLDRKHFNNAARVLGRMVQDGGTRLQYMHWQLLCSRMCVHKVIIYLANFNVDDSDLKSYSWFRFSETPFFSQSGDIHLN